jgi:RNA polymerase sigma-70 factor, ECF subfamily
VSERSSISGFSAQYESLAPAVYGWVALRLDPRVRRHLDPEDLVQEIWWRAYDAYGSYDASRASFRTWIFKIATNVLHDAFRRLRAHPIDAPGPTNSAPKRPEDLIAQVTSISRQVARDEEIARMIASIAALPPEDSRLFLHCALEGLTVTEAAPLAGLSPEAATKRWQRLRTRLRETPTWRRLRAEWHDEPGTSD